MPEGDDRPRALVARIAAKAAAAPHVARDHADRASQFLPFAALTGYEEALRERERQSPRGPREPPGRGASSAQKRGLRLGEGLKASGCSWIIT